MYQERIDKKAKGKEKQAKKETTPQAATPSVDLLNIGEDDQPAPHQPA